MYKTTVVIGTARTSRNDSKSGGYLIYSYDDECDDTDRPNNADGST
jgi:hypothetical protein